MKVYRIQLMIDNYSAAYSSLLNRLNFFASPKGIVGPVLYDNFGPHRYSEFADEGL